MSVVLRAYEPGDWDAVARVHDAARVQELAASVGVAAFLTLAETAEDEGLFDDRVWVAEADGAVVGFPAFADAEVTWMYVHPDHQGRGIGRELLRHAVAHAAAAGLDRVELTVLDGNPARRLYGREGFALVETRSGRLAGNEAFGGAVVADPRRAGRSSRLLGRRRPGGADRGGRRGGVRAGRPGRRRGDGERPGGADRPLPGDPGPDAGHPRLGHAGRRRRRPRTGGAAVRPRRCGGGLAADDGRLGGRRAGRGLAAQPAASRAVPPHRLRPGPGSPAPGRRRGVRRAAGPRRGMRPGRRRRG
ncbi:N-acetyltransferase family protein [Modestobacter sp. SYSU DS0657]